MKKKLVVAGLTTMLGLTWGIGGASAHPVGDASEPNCHGQRVSHGSKAETAGGHGWTPKERAEMLGEQLEQDVSVKEFHQFVRPCEPPPEF